MGNEKLATYGEQVASFFSKERKRNIYFFDLGIFHEFLLLNQNVYVALG